MRTTLLIALGTALWVVCSPSGAFAEPPAPESVGVVADSAAAPVAVPEPSEKAMRYYRSGNVLWCVSLLWGWVVPVGLLATGFSAQMRNLAQRIGRRWFFVVAVYAILFVTLSFVLDLPLSYYSEFVRQHAYDLSNQTFAKWLGDSFKSLGVQIVGGVLLLWIPYWLLRRFPARWWLLCGIGSVPLMLVLQLIGPLYIAPLFNDFGPMKDKSLEADILSLAQRAGIEDSRVFEVDKSVDTKAVNAYVSGFLNTKRIVLWDTIIDKLDRDELLFVMGHEMGHYVLHHVLWFIGVSGLLTTAVLYLIHRVAGGLIARYRARFGFDELSDVASLPLIAALFSVAVFVFSPIPMGISRHYEHEADRFGLELTQNNRAAGTAFVKLQQENLGNPRPGILYEMWRSSHPTLGDRIDFTNAYRPWSQGKPLVYGGRFR